MREILRPKERVFMMSLEYADLPLKRDVKPTDFGEVFRLTQDGKHYLFEVVDIQIQDNVAVLDVYEVGLQTHDQMLEDHPELV